MIMLRRRKEHVRLNPIAAIAIAAAGLALAIGLENDRFGFQPPESACVQPGRGRGHLVATRDPCTSLPEAAEGGPLQRLAGYEPHVAFDDALGRIRQHPVYVMIKEMMTDHLRNHGYNRVPLRNRRTR